jgi:hypothetical protein
MLVPMWCAEKEETEGSVRDTAGDTDDEKACEVEGIALTNIT